MAFEIITLNLIPDGEMPVFHASQYDTARPVIIDLVMGEDAYVVPEGISVELHCRKVDDTIVTMEPDEVSESRVTFVTTEQLTACIGDNLCEVALLNGDDHIGTLNFILHVEPDPLAGGLTSESEIYNLTQQIEDIATEVIGEDYYDKTEVDALLADKADVSELPDMDDYYTKSETESLLSAKANTADLATVATTGDYNDLINKPTIPTNTSDLVNDSEFQNETEVNDLIAAALLDVMPVDSATGNPCSFDTDIATSLVGLSAEIVASGGGGTPSTPIPIVGISSLDIVRCGKNFININGNVFDTAQDPDVAIPFENGLIIKGLSRDGYVRPANITKYEVNGDKITIQTTSTSYGVGFAFRCVEGVTYEVSAENAIYTACSYFDEDGYNISFTSFISGNRSFTTPSNCVWCVLIFAPTTTGIDTDFKKPMVELGSTATAYEPYNGQTFTIDLGGTRYGGVYTADGKLRVTHGHIASYNGESINEPWLSSMDEYVPNTSPSMGAEVVYPLATPIEIDVSSISVNAVSGVNNITSNGNGDVTAQYKVSIQKYIDDHV